MKVVNIGGNIFVRHWGKWKWAHCETDPTAPERYNKEHNEAALVASRLFPNIYKPVRLSQASSWKNDVEDEQPDPEKRAIPTLNWQGMIVVRLQDFDADRAMFSLDDRNILVATDEAWAMLELKAAEENKTAVQ